LEFYRRMLLSTNPAYQSLENSMIRGEGGRFRTVLKPLICG
jgi:hypothetical protein